MSQTPATAKFARWRRLALARLWPSRLRSEDLAVSERAALALRPLPVPEADRVVFLIPLVGRAPVSDWEAVVARLGETLDGFVRQTDGRWSAVVCCQDRPALTEDSRISWLPFDDPTPGNDKWRKLAALCAHLGEVASAPCYAMSFDADDLPHPDLVKTILAGGSGHLVSLGYVRDHARGDVALAGPPTLKMPLRKPFWKLCGSCAALAVDPRRREDIAMLREMTQHEHRMFPYLAQLAGRRLNELPEPLVMYILNHGENFGARRGRVGFKARFVQRFRITDEAVRSRVSEAFRTPR